MVASWTGENRPCWTQPRNNWTVEDGRRRQEAVGAPCFLRSGFVAPSIPSANRILPQPAALRGNTDRSNGPNQKAPPLIPGVVRTARASFAKNGPPPAP